MYELFIFTASRRKAVEDYIKTIKNPVPDNLIAKFLGRAFLKSLRKHNPTEPIYAWGATPKRGNIRVWNAMKVGDYVIAYQRGRLVGLFRIIGKTHNREFAEYLWGLGEDQDDLGMAWEYMYFLQKVAEMDVPSPIVFRGHTGPLKASRIRVEKAIEEALGKPLEEIDAEVKLTVLLRKRPKRIRRPKRGLTFALRILDKMDKGDYFVPDTWTRAKVRIGHSVLREVVLRAYDYTCCICGLDIPDLLDVAHIRPWSVDPHNRLNPENCLSLCSLHHRAYDRHLMQIRDRRVFITEKARSFTSEAARNYLLAYDGKKIMDPIYDFHDVIRELKAEFST